MIELIEKHITPQEFNYLTEKVGWGTRDESLVEEALTNTLYSICAYENNKIVGYGRLIGDKTIFLYVQDVMVVPEYQGKAVGTGIMNQIVDKMKQLKKHSPTLRVYLGASKGREEFYQRFGFVTRSEADLGQGMIWF